MLRLYNASLFQRPDVTVDLWYVPAHETEFVTHYSHVDWLKPTSADSYRRTLPVFAELGLEPCVSLDLRCRNHPLRVLCRAPAYGEVF